MDGSFAIRGTDKKSLRSQQEGDNDDGTHHLNEDLFQRKACIHPISFPSAMRKEERIDASIA